MEILWTLIIGALAGWLAGELYRGSGFGILGNIVVGILGSVVGGLIGGTLGLTPDSSVGSFILAVVGAVVLLFVVNLVTGKRHA